MREADGDESTELLTVLRRAKQKALITGLSVNLGGEGGIRTPD